MKFKKWNLPESRPDVVSELEQSGFSCLSAAVLVSRGVRTTEQATRILASDKQLLVSPFLLRDMDLAVQRIHRALSQKERIAVYGDYDVDGITSTCLLIRYLRSLDADCIHYIPERIEEGYGLNCDAISYLNSIGVTLIITVDCGITAVEEVKRAVSMGIDVIITDHHECKETLPCAVAVIDPYRPDCDYPFKPLAGVGVALKLVLAIGGPTQEMELFDRYSALAAIGTIADVVQMTGENRVLVRHGIDSIPGSEIIGLHKLLHEAGLDEKDLNSINIGYILAPRINASGRIGCADLAAELFLTDDFVRADELAKSLCSLNSERQVIEQRIFKDSLNQLESLSPEQRNAIVLCDENWHQGVIGIVASRLSDKLSCPSFLICICGEKGKGSCRSYGGFNLFAALESASDLLVSYGGHELAAGFSILRENIPAFRRRMNEYACAFFAGETPVSFLDIDAVIEDPVVMNLENTCGLSVLEPYGVGNLRPAFCLTGARIEFMQNIGNNHHLKLRISKKDLQFDCIFFSQTIATVHVAVGDWVDLAFYLQINHYRSNHTVQMQLIDIRPSTVLIPDEESALNVYLRHKRGSPLTCEESQSLVPSYDDFATVWRYLKKNAAQNGIEDNYACLSRKIARSSGLKHALIRTLICLDIFNEQGLITMTCDHPIVHVCLNQVNKKVNLEDSEILTALKRIDIHK